MEASFYHKEQRLKTCLKVGYLFAFNQYFFFFFGFIHFIIPFIKLCGGYSWGLCPLHGDSGVGLYKMVSEFLIWRLGEHRLFPEVRGEVTIGLGNGIKSGLGKVAQGGSAAPGRSVAVVNAGHHQQLLGHRGGDDASASGGRDDQSILFESKTRSNVFPFN